MVGWHHRLNGFVFGWTLGVGDGQGGLACCGSWGCKESDTTEPLNWTELSKQRPWSSTLTSDPKESVLTRSPLVGRSCYMTLGVSWNLGTLCLKFVVFATRWRCVASKHVVPLSPVRSLPVRLSAEDKIIHGKVLLMVTCKCARYF